MTAREPRRRFRRLALRVVAAGVGSLAFAGIASAVTSGSTPAATPSSSPSPASVTVSASVAVPTSIPIVSTILSPVTNQLTYQIHTKGGTGCATDRTVTAVYGVPTPVDTGGSILPDVLVLVAPLPAAPVINNPTILSLTVTKLAVGSLPAEVEAIIAPSGQSDPSRVNLGYDGCESTAPQIFSTQVTSQPTHLSVAMQPTLPGPNLTILAGAFSASGSSRVNPTSAALRVAPVPSQLSAAIDILPNSHYAAHITTKTPTQATLDYLNQTAASTTTAHLTLADLPKTTDVTFSPQGGTWSLSDPVDDATLAVRSTDASRTLFVSGHITGLPTVASFQQDGPTHATFTSNGVIGDATARYATWTGSPAPTLPAIPANPHQSIVASVTPALTVADVHLTGIGSTSGVDWGSQIQLDLVHTQGPFDVDVAVDPVHVVGHIDDLPGTVHVTYTGATQSATYTGSDTIASMVFDVTTTGDPFVGRADHAHLVLTGVPTGLTTSLSSTAKTFATTLTGSPLSTVELTMDNGTTRSLPTGDGLVFYDPSMPSAHDTTSPYFLFLRVSGLTRASFGWGDPLSVDAHHTAAPFDIAAVIGTDTIVGPIQQVLTVGVHLAELPAVSHVSYDTSTADLSHITYSSDTPMPQLTLAVDDNVALTHDAQHLEATLTDLPTTLDLALTKTDDALNVIATTTGNPLGRAVACVGRSSDCGTVVLPNDVDGVHEVDRSDGTAHFLAEVHLGGIAAATISYDPHQVHLALTSAGGRPFRIITNQQADNSASPPVLQTQKVDATIADLPASIDLHYAKDSKTVSYTGSAPIASITAHVENRPDPIAGGSDGQAAAHYLDATLSGLPQSLDLVLAAAHKTDTGLSLDTGCGVVTGTPSPSCPAIGEATIAISDHLTPGLDTSLLGSANGIVLNDFRTVDPTRSQPAEHYDIYAHAVGLEHLEFLNHPDGRPTTEMHSTTLSAHATFNNRRPLLVLSRTDGDATKADGAEYLKASYASPPQNMTISIDHNADGDGTPHTIDVHYTGDTVGTDLRFATNIGAQRTALVAGIGADVRRDVAEGQPIATPDPGPVPTSIHACIGLISADCYPIPDGTSGINSTYGNGSYVLDLAPLPGGEQTHVTVFDCKESGDVHYTSGSFSGSFSRPLTPAEQVDCDGSSPGLVSQPVSGVNVTGTSYSGSITTADLHITHLLKALTASEECVGFDCQLVQLDTGDDNVNGKLIQRHAGDYDPDDDHVGVALYPGFKARDWLREIDCNGPCEGATYGYDGGGRITCTRQMSFLSDALPVEANFVEELCPFAGITTPSAASRVHLAPGSQRQRVRINGSNFLGDLGLDGATDGIVYGEYFPQNGAQPAYVSGDGGIHVDPASIQLNGYDQLSFCVSVDPGTDEGTEGVSIRNAKDHGNSVAPGMLQIDASQPVKTTPSAGC